MDYRKEYNIEKIKRACDYIYSLTIKYHVCPDEFGFERRCDIYKTKNCSLCKLNAILDGFKED